MAETVTCRRCGRVYRLPDRPLLLPACPACGASPRPLLHLARSNTVAGLLAIAGLAVLGFAFVQPFMTMSTVVGRNTMSLLGGIAVLYRQDHHVIASVILVFSVLFPVLKLGLILAATSRLVPASPAQRRRLHAFAALTGKYSLLDVLVLAILVVLVKFETVATVEMRSGTLLFCLAVLLSLAAGLCVNLEPAEPTDG